MNATVNIFFMVQTSSVKQQIEKKMMRKSLFSQSSAPAPAALAQDDRVQRNLARFSSLREQRKLYQNEKNAAKQIISACLENGFRWCVLLAQMQSGKTMTYYFVIAEMLRRGQVRKGIIFSGSAETELREQVEESKKDFFVKYKAYLAAEHIDEYSKDEISDMCELMSEMIEIVWSADLKKYKDDASETFFVWDESHYAQNTGMRPGEFLKKMGICPTGDPEQLAEKNSFLLSVSATPFSELSDQIHMEQHKNIVRMVPGEGYYGVKHMLNANKIIGFHKWRDSLKTALEMHKNDSRPSYAILRKTAKSDITEIRDFAQARGWLVVEYDSENKQIDMSSLNIAPERDTLIVLKGMLRMGKRLDKSHISFAMEMSKSSSSDVVLQGLLGRMCGYNANLNTVIYINERILARGDLEKYVRMMDFGEDVIVSKARNLAGGAGSFSELYEIIPLKIQSFTCDTNPFTESREQLISAIKNAVANFEVQDLNDAQQTMDIMEQVETFDESQFKIARVKSTNSTYAEVPQKIHESIVNKVPIKLGSGCGINASGSEISIFVFHEDYPEFSIKKGDVFLDARTKIASRSQTIDRKITKTNGAEIFGRRLGDLEEPLLAPSTQKELSKDFKIKITTTTETTLKVKKTPTTIRVKKVSTKTKTKLRIIDEADSA